MMSQRYGTINSDLEPGQCASTHVTVRARGGRRPSFWPIAYMVLLGDSVRGIFFPTLWPLVSSLGGTRAHQGVIVAAFSLGRVVVSPWYGAHSTKYGYKGVLVFAHCIIVVGALAYSQVRNLVQLFLAQVILGLGCGTLGVTRAYVAESVPRESRTIMLGRLTAMQYAGLTMTSFLGSLLSKVGRRLSDDPSLAVFHFSPFTMAAYAVLGGALVALGLLHLPTFYDFVPADKAPKPSRSSNDDAPSVAGSHAGESVFLTLLFKRRE